MLINIIKGVIILQSLEEINQKFNVFKNQSVTNIGKKVILNTELLSKKLSIKTLSDEMFKYLNIDTSEFKNNNFSSKTVRLQKSLKPKESMSFEKVEFHDVIKENWKSSFLYHKFSKTTFIFVVFQYNEDELYFKGIKTWRMPLDIIENDLYQFWLLLQNRLKSGVILEKEVKKKTIITTNNLPSSKDSDVMHIRPKAKNSKDVTELPDGQLITKQAYWLNSSYIAQILKDMPLLEKKAKVIQSNKFSNYKEFENLFSQNIYTIENFIQLIQTQNANFTEFNIDKQSLKSIGYVLSPPYIVKLNFHNATLYFQKKILENPYFELPLDSLWQTSFVQRLIINLENNFSLFKIDSGTYLTIEGLKKASFDKDSIHSYKIEVENFIEDNIFFTLQSLKNMGFNHMIDEFGFEDIFYESILTRPGKIHHINLCKKNIFIKSPIKPSWDLFFSMILNHENKNHIELEEIMDYLSTNLKIQIKYENLDQMLCSDNTFKKLFYSNDLKKIFKNKEIYLDFIY